MPKFILVDDFIYQGVVLNKLIQQAGLDFEYLGQANNGEAGIQLIRSTHPDIVFTDIEMPDMDGLEMVKIIRKEFPDIQIVILSAHDNFVYMQQAIRLQVDDYLLKPVNRQKLLDLMGRLREKEEKAVSSRSSTEDPAAENTMEAYSPELDVNPRLFALRQELVSLIMANDYQAITSLIHETYDKYLAEQVMSEKEAIHLISHLTLLVSQALEEKCSRPEAIHLLHETFVSRKDDGVVFHCAQDFANFIYSCLTVVNSSGSNTSIDHIPVVKKYIQDHLAEDLTLDTIAAEVFLSPSHLSRLFRKSTGRTLSEYIREKRMKHARLLLVSTAETIESIGIQCGYPKANTFWKTFKKEVGVSPGDYRAQNTTPESNSQ